MILLSQPVCQPSATPAAQPFGGEAAKNRQTRPTELVENDPDGFLAPVLYSKNAAPRSDRSARPPADAELSHRLENWYDSP